MRYQNILLGMVAASIVATGIPLVHASDKSLPIEELKVVAETNGEKEVVAAQWERGRRGERGERRERRERRQDRRQEGRERRQDRRQEGRERRQDRRQEFRERTAAVTAGRSLASLPAPQVELKE